MIRWCFEIKKVGLVNWVWYTFWLRRDIFSRKLNTGSHYKTFEKLSVARKRAYAIDDKISDLIFEGYWKLSPMVAGAITGVLFGFLTFYLLGKIHV